MAGSTTQTHLTNKTQPKSKSSPGITCCHQGTFTPSGFKSIHELQTQPWQPFTIHHAVCTLLTHTHTHTHTHTLTHTHSHAHTRFMHHAHIIFFTSDSTDFLVSHFSLSRPLHLHPHTSLLKEKGRLYAYIQHIWRGDRVPLGLSVFPLAVVCCVP